MAVTPPEIVQKLDVVQEKLKVFTNFTEMGLDTIFYKKGSFMTVTATNVLILGAVFMFAARVFMGF